MSLPDFLAVVIHAHDCRIPGCRAKKCHKTKRLLDHNRQCKRKPCTMCASLIKVYNYHAKQCPKDSGCRYKFCKNAKHKQKHILPADEYFENDHRHDPIKAEQTGQVQCSSINSPGHGMLAGEDTKFKQEIKESPCIKIEAEMDDSCIKTEIEEHSHVKTAIKIKLDEELNIKSEHKRASNPAISARGIKNSSNTTL